MRDQWEYKILMEGFFNLVLRDRDGVKYGELTEATLNRLGQEGWEVCGWLSLGGRRTLILKRRCDPSG